MELRHLRYLVAIADHGSVSRAARTLHVAQSAVSEQIADLEAETGVSLFDRTHRKIRLTPHGEMFLIEARKTLAAAAYAIEVARGSQRGELGEIRIGFFAGGIGIEFPKVIRAFRRAHPQVRVSLAEMSPTAQWQALLDGHIDIGLTRMLETPYRDELRWETVREDAVVAVLPRDHPLVPGPIHLRDLAQEAFVLTARETSPALFDKVIELCSEAGFSPRIAGLSTVWSSVALLVEAGVGISLLPLNLQQETTHDLAYCRLTAPNAFIELVMAWPAVRDSALLQSLRELVRLNASNL
jgi:DNA-binding transcriptional LysR family regulator